MQLQYLFITFAMTTSYGASVGTLEGRARTRKDVHKPQELHEKAYICEVDLQ